MSDLPLDTLRECLHSISVKSQPLTWQNPMAAVEREADHSQKSSRLDNFRSMEQLLASGTEISNS